MHPSTVRLFSQARVFASSAKGPILSKSKSHFIQEVSRVSKNLTLWVAVLPAFMTWTYGVLLLFVFSHKPVSSKNLKSAGNPQVKAHLAKNNMYLPKNLLIWSVRLTPFMGWCFAVKWKDKIKYERYNGL
ncbi:hypothetical protein NADFUDRAFT_52814 [Nadsonia fulvescens var. elongata DSM 6958]|uniref:Uncharacterized protein n=1 Tax=Nadsonia fulvescens var. elongata DSM 6958 TaxID=857566 RepID=A0A1E3PEI6_9ASCO|nr:hypothetical protein NADFUDRAFT_52814 [Nadsonia fulvescens var. elongata DSM 6958]